MLKLDHHLTLDEPAIKSSNLASQFGTQDLEAIGSWVHNGYTEDKSSRHVWEKRNNAALDLAMQLQKEKTFPWAGASNVAFPLVTIGAMQFHARAYPTIIQGVDVVKMRVIGPDDDGTETEKANRVGQHMSYQVLEEDGAWEEQHDRALLILGITGSVFFKTYYDPKANHNVSELILPRDFVINYWAKSVESAARKTHRIPLSRNDIRSRVLAGVYCKTVLEEGWFQEPKTPEQTNEQRRADTRIGQRPAGQADETTPYFGLEMHCDLDLDGDGYAEPYIITIEESSKCVLRILSAVARIEDIDRVEDGEFKGEIISIRREEYFTKYEFIPSPDGGIYGIGFGTLLGPLNESVNSIINQLVDAGTMANTAGGFLGRGAKIRGGVYMFKPFEWNRVDSTGDDLHKSIFPLPVRDPSAVLFQLLGLLVDYANRISGATDTNVGENPGQNTPAQTTQTMVEMGMKIYNSIFKRVWRAMKGEFKKLYTLNAINLPASTRFGTSGTKIGREDYRDDPDRIVPYADPNITSEAQGVQQAMALKQFAATTPGYNRDEVEKRVLRSMKVDGIDTIFPGMGSEKATPSPQDPRIQLEQIKQQGKQAELQLQQQQFTMQLQDEMRLTTAKIADLEADAAMKLEQANGVQSGHELAQFDAYLGLLKLHKEHLSKQVLALLDHHNQQLDRQHEQKLAALNSDQPGAMAAVAPGPSDAMAPGMGQPAQAGAA